MIGYKGKAICGFGCGKRGKWEAQYKGNRTFACNEHKNRLEGYPDPKRDTEHYTEADYQTWMGL